MLNYEIGTLYEGGIRTVGFVHSPMLPVNSGVPKNLKVFLII